MSDSDPSFYCFFKFRNPDFIGIREHLENPASATITSKVVGNQHFGRFICLGRTNIGRFWLSLK